ncbi:MAG TPA: hypothetical protein PLE43_02960 [Alphaproteobacteria bacterium]|nr:hypothetical protein [Alphaproteobacteria bacterium]
MMNDKQIGLAAWARYFLNRGDNDVDEKLFSLLHENISCPETGENVSLAEWIAAAIGVLPDQRHAQSVLDAHGLIIEDRDLSFFVDGHGSYISPDHSCIVIDLNNNNAVNMLAKSGAFYKDFLAFPASGIDKWRRLFIPLDYAAHMLEMIYDTKGQSAA